MEKIAAINEVQTAVEATMRAVVDYLKTEPAPTAEAAHILIDEILEAHDCESPKGHIVAGGPASAEPHEQGSGLLQPGQPIVIDIYPRSKTTDYWADMTRTVCLGAAPAELQKLYDTVLAAQELAISLIAPGVRAHGIQKAVTKFFADAGYQTTGTGTEFRFAEGFVHSIGHGVTTDIHAEPHFGAASEAVLSVGDIITIEPGLYYKHLGGVRLEDLILVTEAGHQNLTSFPKQLII